MENCINERIKLIVEYIGKPINSIAKEIGVSQPTLKACVDGSNKPSFDTIQKILSTYTDINPTWLVVGEGKMLLDFTIGITGGENPVIDKEFNDIVDDISILEKLKLSNPKIKNITDLYEDFEGNAFMIHSYLHEYNLHNKMITSAVLDCYRDKKIKISDVQEYFKAKFQAVKELYQIIEPYKEIMQELHDKISDFNDANDRFFCIDDD